MRRIAVLATVSLLVATVGLLGGAHGAGASADATSTPFTCDGTVQAPGTVGAGTYSSLEVTGVCDISSGAVHVVGDVVVAPGAALVSAFSTGSLQVGGDLTAGAGSSLVLGCDAAHFVCLDDPTSPTATSSTDVAGDLVATDPLGVVIHRSVVAGDLAVEGGGGGVACSPSPSTVFGSLPGDGGVVYSDLEDLTIGQNLRVTGLGSCWLGALRLSVGGSATFADDTFADPDADEILNNQVAGNLLCTDLSPTIQFGDAGQPGNTVGGYGTGDCAFSRHILYPGSNPPVDLPIATPDPTARGYWLAGNDGGIFSFGAGFFGSGSGTGESISGIAANPGGTGYSLASSAGQVTAYSPAADSSAVTSCSGSLGALRRPVVGMAPAPGGDGCWLVASDGGVFALGSHAPFYGSAGALPLNRPVVGMAPAPNGDGYYLVASDGGIFNYGPGTVFQGSMGGQHLNQPIVGMAVDPSTGGYWLVASDGGIFSFGAPFLGSLGAVHLNQPIVGMAAAPGGDGYYLVAADGGVFAFGAGAVFQGSTGALHLNRPIIGMALG